MKKQIPARVVVQSRGETGCRNIFRGVTRPVVLCIRRCKRFQWGIHTPSF